MFYCESDYGLSMLPQWTWPAPIELSDNGTFADVVAVLKRNEAIVQRATKRCKSGMLPNPPCGHCLVRTLLEGPDA